MERKLQHGSGLVIGVFLGMHFLTTLAIHLGGVERFNSAQLFFRRIYQHVAFESILLLSIVVHSFLSAKKLLATKNLRSKLTWHRLSGIYLLMTVGMHLTATRFLGYHLKGEGVSMTMVHMPAIMPIYYTLMALSGLVHLVVGLQYAAVTFNLPSLRAAAKSSALKAGAVAVGLGLVWAILKLWGIGPFGPLPYDPYANDYAAHFLEMEKSMKLF